LYIHSPLSDRQPFSVSQYVDIVALVSYPQGGVTHLWSPALIDTLVVSNAANATSVRHRFDFLLSRPSSGFRARRIEICVIACVTTNIIIIHVDLSPSRRCTAASMVATQESFI